MLLMTIQINFMLSQTCLNWDVDQYKLPNVHDPNQMPLSIS